MIGQSQELERKGNGQIPKGKGSFMCKLTQILKLYPEVIGWTEDGSQIRVSNIEKMEQEIIPAYYRHSNINSFVRQLNMYYFSKLETPNKNEMIFENKNFNKDNQDSLHLIQRRNKCRDQMIDGIHQQFSATLERINQHRNINEETKSMIKAAIEYGQITIKNLQKIKLYLVNLSNQMKSSRGKQVKKILQDFKQTYPRAIDDIIRQGYAIQKYVENNLCADDENPPPQTQNFPLIVSRSHQNQSLAIFIPRQSQASMIPKKKSVKFGEQSENQEEQSRPVSFLQNFEEENKDREEEMELGNESV